MRGQADQKGRQKGRRGVQKWGPSISLAFLVNTRRRGMDSLVPTTECL